MLQLLLASALFVAIHIFISGTPVRAKLVGSIGETAYQGGFSLLSLGALVWAAFAYGEAPYVELWADQPGLKHAASLIVFVAMLFVVLGLTTPNPTSAGQDKVLQRREPAAGVIKVTRHPFLWGVALWALAHVMANGHLASLVLFGSLLLLSLIGPHLIDRKRRQRDPEAWAKFAAVTSWVPFAAILQGRARLSLGELGWWRLAVAVIVYAGFGLYLHAWLFGPAPFGV